MPGSAWHAWVALLVGCLAGIGVAPAQQARGDADAGEYLLGPEDVVHVQVWGRPDLSGSAALSATGKLLLPLVGEVTAAGRTVVDLGRYLTQQYQVMDPNIPDVILSVAEYNSRSVTVVGEVRVPGRLTFRTLPDLWGVLLAAGGATPVADLERVQVVRHAVTEGEQRTFTIDLSQGIENIPAGELPVIKPKDTVVVPSLAEEAGGGNRLNVLGAVRSPGVFSLTNASTLIEAIAASGGATPDADLRRVHLTRVAETGLVSYELDLSGHLYEAMPDVDMELKPGDTITVPAKKSTLASIMDTAVRLGPMISVILGLGYAFR